jgi:hypothetical protein
VQHSAAPLPGKETQRVSLLRNHATRPSVGILVSTPFVGAADYFADLAMILAFPRDRTAPRSTGGRPVLSRPQTTIRASVLLWTFYNSVYPISDFPRNLWAYVVAVWILAGAVLLRLRAGPVIGRRLTRSSGNPADQL